MKINDKQGYNIKFFAKDIRQWVHNIVTKYKTDGIFIKINFMENSNISSNNIQLNKYCGICMDRLDFFGVDYSLKCLHVLCWCCILRLRYLLNLRECPFCKHSVNKILLTSNIQYLKYIVNNSLDFGEKNEFYPKFLLSINDKLSKILLEDEVDSILFNEKIGIYFESFVSRWAIERIMEVRCWIPKCRPKYLPLNKNKLINNDLKFLLESSDNFKTIRELGDHIFRYHNLKCCFVCIEKRHTMLLPEHMLYEVNDINRHMKKGEPLLQPPIFPHILCPVCRIWCLDKDDFTDHVKNEHFSCNICEQRIISNSKDLNEDNNNYIFSKKRINYVYSDYNSLQNHWRDEHYPCDNEDCMFIVFENESELIDHKATCHSRNRWNNIQIPISINYTDRSEIQYRNNNNNNIPLMNFSDIETPALCLPDELCNEIIKKLRNDKSFLWRNILLHDLTRCIKIISEELEITLGLKEKCNDFSFWSLEMINNLFISNDIIINGIKKIGILYKDNKISPISFLLEIIFLIWGNLNISLPKRSLQDLKKQFGNIATAPNTIRIFFSCIPDPINILGIDGINYTKVSYQQMENILFKEINWSLLYSDINTMILISLILGLSDIEQRSKLINGIRIFKDAIESQSIIIIPSKNPRFSLNITEELKPYIFKKDEELVLNNKIVKEMKYICLEKFIQPNQMLLTSGTSFLVAMSSFFEIIWPKVQTIEEIFNYLLNNEDKEKLDRQFLILCSSQTINELNTLALLYQHTISITSSVTVAEKILGLRAPYYRLAASLSDERNNNMKSDSLSLRQWWNLCVKTFNKVNITDIEVIMIYCQCCLKVLNNCIKNNISNVKNYNSVIKVDHNEEPKTVIASREIIYTPLKSNSIKFSQFNKGKNTWFSNNTSSYFNQNLNLSKTYTSTNTTSTQILSNSSSYASKVKVNIDRTLEEFSEEKDFELEQYNNELFNKEKKFPVLLSNNKKNSKSELLSWKCSLCTYDNLPSRNRCLMCNTKK
ncbi:hypothetical protein cand_029250 [Cryptosporidium andersoni]|uniref:RanBP-type and C3HC4-type zinc finger-containing protein 1 n=1 Tax=Cryptosporidium andersoni TaxID=117008 RepID=A0A1J4MNM7_9CRYT|nr:hypothetical protein cand_029250 [Cryptosporidium andersoni]